MSVRIAHIWSSDLGIPWSAAYSKPLLARGWEVWHITPDGPHAARARAQGTPWLPLSLERRFAPRSDITGAQDLLSHLSRHRFDIVHTHASKPGLLGRLLAARARVPVVLHTVHGTLLSPETARVTRAAHRVIETVAGLYTDRILFQSREDMETYIGMGVIPSDRAVRVGNGIDLSRFSQTLIAPLRESARDALGVRNGELLFLTGGRLVREKGIVELIEAAVIARRRDSRVLLAIAGERDTERADAVPQKVVDRARAAGVLMLGRREDMAALYSASDVVVLASWREGMPRLLMEGAACGRALLCSDVRGNREIVEHGVNGLRVRPRDAASLGEAMCALASDAGMRARFGAANVTLAREHFDVREVARRVERVCERALLDKGILRQEDRGPSQNNT